MTKFTEWIIGAILAGAAAAAMAQSAVADSPTYDDQQEPRNGYVFDSFAGYAPDEEPFPVKTEAPGVETVNRGGEARSAWQSDANAWIEGDPSARRARPAREVIVGDPDVAQVVGRG